MNALNPHDDVETEGAVKATPINAIYAFFAWFGGSDIHLLREEPSYVVAKRAATGFVMFVCVAFSGILAAVVWSDIKGISYGIKIGVIWFLLMFGIERVLMILIDNEYSKEEPKNYKTVGERIVGLITGKQMYFVIARLVLIYYVASFNAEMVQMQIFGAEITAHVHENRSAKLNRLNDSVTNLLRVNEQRKLAPQKEYDAKNTLYQNVMGEKLHSIANIRDTMMTHQTDLNKEIQGRVGSGLKGDGPAAQSLRETVRRDSQMVENMTQDLAATSKTMPEYIALQQSLKDKNDIFTEVSDRANQIRSDAAHKKAELTGLKLDGFADREIALQDISKKSPLVNLFFMLLFIVEALPMIFKMMMGKDTMITAIKFQAEQQEQEKFYEKTIALEQAKNAYEKTMARLKNESLQDVADAKEVRSKLLSLESA